ncbi:MAG: lipopolysaccharide biosynthesis protein [Gemmataceae bacterium]
MENSTERPIDLSRTGIVAILRSSGLSGLKASPEIKRLAGDTVWVVGGQVGATLGTLVGMRILTSFLPPAIFGTISLLIGCLTLVTSTFCAPYFQAALRFYPEAARKGQLGRLRRVITSGLKWSVAAIGGVILIVWALARNELGISYFGIVALAGLGAVEVFASLETNFFQAARRNRPYALWQGLICWVRPLMAVVAVSIWGPKPEAVLIGYAVGTLGLFIVYRGIVKREDATEETATDEEEADLSNRIRKYALPLIPLAIVGWVSAVSDRYIIGGLLGLEAVGLYVAAYSIISRGFGFLSLSIELILRPVYFEAVASGQRVRARNVFRFMLGITVGGGLLGVLAVALFKEEIRGLLVAESYRSSTRLMPWIAVGYLFLITSYVFEKICYAYQRTKWVTIGQLTGAVSSIVITIPLIYLCGLDGAAMAVPIYYAVQLLVFMLASSHVLACASRGESGERSTESVRNAKLDDK